MSDHDRRIRNDSWKQTFQLQVKASVHGNVEVDEGDLLFFDGRNGLRNRGASTLDGYVYPFSEISGSTLTLASNRTLAYQNFIGVAGTYSESGVTEDITVYLQGLFRYPLRNTKSVKTGMHYVVPAGSGVTLYNQVVAIVTSGCSDIIGIVAETGEFKSEVEMVLSSKVMGLNNFYDLKK